MPSTSARVTKYQVIFPPSRSSGQSFIDTKMKLGDKVKIFKTLHDRLHELKANELDTSSMLAVSGDVLNKL